MNELFIELTVIGQVVAQVLVVGLFLHRIASKLKIVPAQAVASQRKRAQ